MSDSPVKPYRILLIDDEADLVEFLSHRLVKRGFTVTATTAGEQALAACARNRFDVALIDLKMPGMDGIEVLTRLKEHQPFLQAIMLTGHGSHESALEAGKQDAFRYLLKPYDFEDLLPLLEEAAAATRQAQLEAFLAERTRVASRGGTSREISEAMEHLRRTYDQD